jgi:uncharacterized protein YbjT (DUF2867 family)
MIVITTPTGQVGRQLLTNILDSGESVRVIAREPSRLPAVVRKNVEIVAGTHGDSRVLIEACADADSVFWLVPPNVRSGEAHKYYLDFTRPLCEAICERDVKRVVAVSTIGRGTTDAGFVSAALAMDELIESTGVHYRSLSIPSFMENMLQQIEPLRNQGMFFGVLPGDRVHPHCATRDMAAAAARLLLDPSWTGQVAVPVLGPQDLSMDDMARIMSEELGEPIRYQRISMEDLRQNLIRSGASQEYAQAMIDMAGKHHETLANTAARTPESSSPTTFRQWSREVLKPAIAA